jgi:hypothetical protein
LISASIHVTVAHFRHEMLGYTPSEKQGFKPRLRHALLGTIRTRKTTTGAPTPAIGRITGSIGGGLISRLWHPSRLHTVGSGFATAGLSLSVDTGLNVVREFWPEIRHPRRKKAEVTPAPAPASLPHLELEGDSCAVSTSSSRNWIWYNEE